MKKNLLVLALITSIFYFKTNAQESIKSFKGTWTYTCNDAPYGYQSGTLIIDSAASTNTAKVVYEDGSSVNAHTLKIKAGVLYFSVVVENELINVQLKKNGDKLKGKTINGYGEELILTAVRKS